MKQEEALQYIERFMFVLQKYRSVCMESLSPKDDGLGFTEDQLSEIWPWIFGPKCPLPVLAKMSECCKISGLDFYNLMFILDHFMPEVKVAGSISFCVSFPDPDTAWLVNWDKEEQ